MYKYVYKYVNSYAMIKKENIFTCIFAYNIYPAGTVHKLKPILQRLAQLLSKDCNDQCEVIYIF